MTIATAKPAQIDTVGGRRWWRCPDCRHTLGELTGGILIVKVVNRQIRLPIVTGTEQDCPRCGGTSVLERDKLTA